MVVFSAIHMALNCGEKVFVSDGASVPGVIWKTIRTPSTVSTWPVFWIDTVGRISVAVPRDVVCPSPPLTPPCGLRGSMAPYM
ncbi:hypothetical protein D3C81_1441150 [compost metagenome]